MPDQPSQGKCSNETRARLKKSKIFQKTENPSFPRGGGLEADYRLMRRCQVMASPTLQTLQNRPVDRSPLRTCARWASRLPRNATKNGRSARPRQCHCEAIRGAQARTAAAPLPSGWSRRKSAFQNLMLPGRGVAGGRSQRCPSPSKQTSSEQASWGLPSFVPSHPSRRFADYARVTVHRPHGQNSRGSGFFSGVLTCRFVTILVDSQETAGA